MNDAATKAMMAYVEGDSKAFGVLYSILAPRLRSHIDRLVHHQESLVEEFLQQTFLMIHEHRSSFRAKACVCTWAYAIATNLVTDYFRSAAYRLCVPIDTHEDFMDTQDPEKLLQIKQQHEVLRACVSELPPQQRMAYKASVAEDQNCEQQAVSLRITNSGARVTAFNMRRSLRKSILDKLRSTEDP